MFLDLLQYATVFLRHQAETLIGRSSHFRSKRKELDSGDIKVIKEAAQKLGIEVENLGFNAYELKKGNIIRRIKTDMTNDLDNAFTYWLTGNKYVTFEILKKYGIKNIPCCSVYSLANIQDARRDFLDRKKAVVVKPCYGTSGGRGVTVDIRILRDLKRAIYTALIYDRHYVIEDFIEGDSYRLLFLKDILIGAVRRIPANVKGDGIHSIKKLISQENWKRLNDNSYAALVPINQDNDLKQKLKNTNISLDYIPSKGELIYIKSICNFSAGGESEEVSRWVNDGIIEECRKIVKIMNLSLAGIDIITNDISESLSKSGGIINEVNTSPGLDLHYKVKNQEERREVAVEILGYMFNLN